jgi:hypothetical protein
VSAGLGAFILAAVLATATLSGIFGMAAYLAQAAILFARGQ